MWGIVGSTCRTERRVDNSLQTAVEPPSAETYRIVDPRETRIEALAKKVDALERAWVVVTQKLFDLAP